MPGLRYTSYYGEENVTRTLQTISDIHQIAFEQRIANQLKNQGDCSVLDIGSGNSSFTIELARKFPDASFYGIDVCSDETRGFKPSRRPKNLHFSIQDGNSLAFSDNSFDIVTATWSVTKYLPDDFADRPTTHITEIARVLKLGGIASIHPELPVFNYLSLDSIQKKLDEADYPNKDKITRKVADYQLVKQSGVSVQFLEDPNRTRMTKYI